MKFRLINVFITNKTYHIVPLLTMAYLNQIQIYFGYLQRVEKRILPVGFFVNFYSMDEDISLKIGIDDPYVLSYDKIKA